MNYRHVELLGLKTINADQTEVVDIDLADPISRIILDLRVINGGGASTSDHPVASVTKIEVVDGSEVLYNLTGMCAHALDIYCNGNHPRGGWYNYLPGTETELHLAMDFGRYLYDPVLAFDPKRFTNPQLKVTHDISVGGMNPSACKMAIYAEVFDEKVITPTGFLMAKEIKTWSGTAGTHNYTDLPTDYKYRKLLVQGLKRGSPTNWVLDVLKLSEDQDKRVVFNDHMRDLMFGLGRENAYIRETWTCGGPIAAQYRHITPCMDTFGTATSWTQTLGAKDIALYAGNGGLYEIITEVAANCQFTVAGWAPHSVLCIPFGDQMNMDDWYDVSRIGSLKLDVTDGQTTTVEKIFIQQYRPY